MRGAGFVACCFQHFPSHLSGSSYKARNSQLCFLSSRVPSLQASPSAHLYQTRSTSSKAPNLKKKRSKHHPVWEVFGWKIPRQVGLYYTGGEYTSWENWMPKWSHKKRTTGPGQRAPYMVPLFVVLDPPQNRAPKMMTPLIS